MKTIWSFVVVFFVSQLYSQGYSFDNFLTYTMESNENDKNFRHDHIIGINSSDSTYYAAIHNDEYGTELEIFDLVRKKMHLYEITKKKIDSVYKNLYTYVETKDFHTLKKRFSYVFDFKEITKNDSIQTVELSIYASPKRKPKHLVVQSTISLKPAKVNLFSAFKYGFHPFEFDVEFAFPHSVIVLESVEITKNTCSPNHIKLVAIAQDYITLIPPKKP